MNKNIKSIVTNLAFSKFSSRILLFGFYFMIAAAAHCGFMSKWALTDESDTRFSFKNVIDGQASKPFVYRQLIPSIARAGQTLLSEEAIPSVLKDTFLNKFNPSKYFAKATSANLPGYEFGYRIIVLVNFLALLISLFILKSISQELGGGTLDSTLAPAVFVLAFPYVQTISGHYYDSVELLFFSVVTLLALKGKVFTLPFISALATLNKESFIFFLPTLYPFLRDKLALTKTIMTLSLSAIVCLAVYICIGLFFSSNSGGATEDHFLNNLQNYLSPSYYFQSEVTYGTFSPKGVSLLALVPIFIIVIRGLTQVNAVTKKHLLIALIINIPLFMLYCSTGELRNLSLTFVGFVILISGALRSVKP